MKVILVDRVLHLGNVGEIVNVSNGYFRNFLAPRKLAVYADEKNQKQLDMHKKRLGKKVDEHKKSALATKQQIDGLRLEFVKKVGANGKLFGTVTTVDLARELEAKGISVERRLMVIPNPIKSVGTFDVKVKLFQDVEAKFQVQVVMDPEQAEELKAKSKAAKKVKKVETTETPSDIPAQPERELTDDEKLSIEANKILRS
ncbi:MAG: 50S ribosomal protein L9 [Bdellovibrio sp.]|nr:50S ribosomal protein L9 [Bdellovibrio sp.]